MTTKRKVFIIILSIAIVLTLAFIWTRSLSTGGKSSEESNRAYDTSVEVVRDVAGEHPAEVYKETITEHIFRKLAHFFEYSVLGLEVNLLFLFVFLFTFFRFVRFLFLCCNNYNRYQGKNNSIKRKTGEVDYNVDKP